MRIQEYHSAFFPIRRRLMIAEYGSESRPPLICQSQPKSIHLQHFTVTSLQMNCRFCNYFCNIQLIIMTILCFLFARTKIQYYVFFNLTPTELINE